MHSPEPAAAEPAAAPAKPRLAALIPCYREEGHVGGVVRGAREAGFDAIVVDDGSPDRTADEAREAGATEVVVHEVNQGKGAAMSTGLRRALELGYDAVVLMDDHLSRIPEAMAISRKTMRLVKENITFSIAVKVIIMILGAFGIANMRLAIFGDVGVLILAILNALRAMRVPKSV